MADDKISDYLAQAFSCHKVTQRASRGYINAIKMHKECTTRLISGDLSLVYDLIQRYESLNAGMRVLATVTTAGTDVCHDVHERLHLVIAIEQDYVQPTSSIDHEVKDGNTGEDTGGGPGQQVTISWISRFISGDLHLVHELAERHESMNAGTRVLATITMAGADIRRDAHIRMHVVNAMGQPL